MTDADRKIVAAWRAEHAAAPVTVDGDEKMAREIAALMYTRALDHQTSTREDIAADGRWSAADIERLYPRAEELCQELARTFAVV
jgi:hypothetical protein